MGTCVSRDQIHNNCSTGLASVRHHPQGVAGLPAHNIDEDPQHHIVPGNVLCQILYFKIMTFKYFIPGIVTSNPYVEVNDILLLKHKYNFMFLWIRRIWGTTPQLATLQYSQDSLCPPHSQGPNLILHQFTLQCRRWFECFFIQFFFTAPKSQPQVLLTLERQTLKRRSTPWSKEDWLHQAKILR